MNIYQKLFGSKIWLFVYSVLAMIAVIGACKVLPTGSASQEVRQVEHKGHELILQGLIDDALLEAVRTELSELHDSITLVSLASPGGDVDAATEIQQMLQILVRT